MQRGECSALVKSSLESRMARHAVPVSDSYNTAGNTVSVGERCCLCGRNSIFKCLFVLNELKHKYIVIV